MYNNKLFSLSMKLAVVGIFTYTSNFMQIPESSFAQMHTDKSKSSIGILKLAESQLNIAENSDGIKFIESDEIDYGLQSGRRIPESTFAGDICHSVDLREGHNLPLALIPGNDISKKFDPYAPQIVTEQSNLVLWVYIPYKSSTQVRAEFSLKDHPARRSELKDIPGIVKIKSDTSLEIRKDYQWKLIITCQGTKHFLYGHVKRLPKANGSPTSSSSPEEKVKYYAGKGLLTDAFTTIFEDIKCANGKRYNGIMSKLLIQIGLTEDFSTQPTSISCIHTQKK